MSMQFVRKIYEGNSKFREMGRQEARDFQIALIFALKEISATYGYGMLKEIRAANNEVQVVKAGKGQGNTCVLELQTEQAKNAASYKEVIESEMLQQKIQELANSGKITSGHPAAKKYVKFHGPNSIHYTTVRGETGNRRVAVAHLAKTDGRTHSTDQSLAGRIRNFDEKPEIQQAIGSVRRLQNGLVGYHIMEHLTPGAGTGAYVVWDPDLKDVGGDLGLTDRAPWMTRPSWIALAHELIHAWRLVTGKCVFHPDPVVEYYYEEAMTVGLPPYDGCKFTENRFRQAKGLPLRSFYGANTRIQSETAQKKHGSVSDRIT